MEWKHPCFHPENITFQESTENKVSQLATTCRQSIVKASVHSKNREMSLNGSLPSILVSNSFI